MEKKLHLLVSTNGGTVVDDYVEYVLLPMVGGGCGILPGHAPLIGALDIGVMKVDRGNKEIKYLAMSGGVVSVNNNEVTVLVRSAEKASQIDIARAQAAEHRAREREEENHEDERNHRQEHWDHIRLEASLRRALAREHAYEMLRKM